MIGMVTILIDIWKRSNPEVDYSCQLNELERKTCPVHLHVYNLTLALIWLLTWTCVKMNPLGNLPALSTLIAQMLILSKRVWFFISLPHCQEIGSSCVILFCSTAERTCLPCHVIGILNLENDVACIQMLYCPRQTCYAALSNVNKFFPAELSHMSYAPS